MFKRKYIFTGSIFHCYVRLLECSFQWRKTWNWYKQGNTFFSGPQKNTRCPQFCLKVLWVLCDSWKGCPPSRPLQSRRSNYHCKWHKKRCMHGKSWLIHSLKSNSSHLKMDGWNTTFLLGRPIFRGELLVLGRVNVFAVVSTSMISSQDTEPERVNDMSKLKRRNLAFFLHM